MDFLLGFLSFAGLIIVFLFGFKQGYIAKEEEIEEEVKKGNYY